MSKIPKRRKRETLIQWLTRIMHRDLDKGRLVNALWMAQLIRRL